VSAGRLAGEALLDALESGEVRVAQRSDDGAWSVNDWVKEEILEIFRHSPVVAHGDGAARDRWPFVDKEALPVRHFRPGHGVRLVPGGSSVRRGAHVAPGVVCMPPMYVNIGAFIGADSMVDSHALIGSCAQVGERVHVSAAAQIGGVLEPVRARPVIVEDDVLVGGNTGLYEGVLVRERAVIAAGVVLTASTVVYDLVNKEERRGSADDPLEIPAGAVVVPGTRPIDSAWARDRGLSVACALIVKYRDARTDAATALEEALR
jgi:2,3,4,5-tetrahydropyridine-2-carboxylate N-succinyltransferase